ncbi:unnamed protein product, partial [Nesidiocoris tenuis]
MFTGFFFQENHTLFENPISPVQSHFFKLLRTFPNLGFPKRLVHTRNQKPHQRSANAAQT